jgi:hypothetical protein
MVAFPVEAPVTTPVEEPTVATEPLLLLHVPPDVAVLSDIEEPIHIEELPEIAAGRDITVTTVETLHPVDNVYVMLATPALTPVTTPVAEATLAVAVEPRDQVPPPVLESVVVDPAQTIAVPEIAEGNELIITVTLPCVPQQPDEDLALK